MWEGRSEVMQVVGYLVTPRCLKDSLICRSSLIPYLVVIQ